MVDAVYQPGVLLGGMEKATSQARSLLHAGDVVTAVDGLPLKGRKGDVSALVNAITCAPLWRLAAGLQPAGRGAAQCSLGNLDTPAACAIAGRRAESLPANQVGTYIWRPAGRFDPIRHTTAGAARRV